ncbi:MAG: 3'(2'),5'-bisphosphate nucleotidase CysQ [Flammeovirgaceae bacterium]|nr:3'(2'),5'-bisphosphate nucleotidase CysQ [Flammeovirgaceae bacterium]MDW8287798.1 3'(2'),5'-bisphosphate nucleotidase CysQ [Flammeovirgaceae bacterium]
MHISLLYNNLQLAQRTAITAGKEIMSFYHAQIKEEKKADQSPITIADKTSHEIIIKELSTTSHPMLSEEGEIPPYEERRKWNYFWMIDPLDGTREFIDKTGDFTVNIALIHQGIPVLGVVYLPVSETLFFALKGFGAFKENKMNCQKIKAASFSLTQPKLKVVASRSNFDEKTKNYIACLNKPKLIHIGGARKFMKVACGEAHIYPRFAPTMEWDTAAAQIIVEEAGGKVCQTDGKTPLTYNKENLSNPYFIAFGELKNT